MDAELSFIEIGVPDAARSRAFYHGGSNGRRGES
jgi:hypothetical protein